MAKVTLELTPAQLRMVNAGLAAHEVNDHEYDDPPFRYDVMRRTRRIVWDAMEKAGVDA